MAIATTAYVAEVGGFFERTILTYLDAPLRRASRRLSSWVGATTYNAAVLALAGTEPRDTFKEAEALLAVAEALDSMNRVDTGKGITKTANMSNMQGNATTSYLTPEDVLQNIRRLRSDAQDLVASYLAVAPVTTYETFIEPEDVL